MNHLPETIAHIGLTVIIILFIITGLGITNYQIIEQITFGALTKPLSFEIHDNLLIPLIFFLGLHIYFALNKKKKEKANC